MNACLEALPFHGSHGVAARLSGASHFAGVMRGLLFLGAVVAPFLVLGSLDGSSERARHLNCVERALAVNASANGTPLLACYNK